jgi:PKD repeat protein
MSVTWNFGDGTSSNLWQPTHVYIEPGTYTVTVQVSGLSCPLGVAGAGMGTVVVAVRPNDFLQVMPVGNPTSGPSPLNTTFHAWVVGGYAPYRFQWDFGDGTTGTGQDITHTYSRVGTFTATVTVTDGQGTSTSGSQSVFVNALGGITVSTSVSPTQGFAPVVASYIADAKGGSAPYTYSWSFSDGSTQAGSQVSKAYPNPGTYVAFVTVTDINGSTSGPMPAPAVNVYPEMVGPPFP